MRKPALWMLALTLTACTTSTTQETTVPPTLDPSWFTYEGPPSTHAALLSGTLSIDIEARCIRVGDHQAVFPEGTSLDLSDPDRPGLLMPSGRTVYSGEVVEFGGGDTRVPVAGRTENCGSEGNFAVGS